MKFDGDKLVYPFFSFWAPVQRISFPFGPFLWISSNAFCSAPMVITSFAWASINLLISLYRIRGLRRMERVYSFRPATISIVNWGLPSSLFPIIYIPHWLMTLRSASPFEDHCKATGFIPITGLCIFWKPCIIVPQSRLWKESMAL